ncbi:uncharacterized protein K02A2.6-like [Ornithodoros turicata]|uniref:uncharacterized protein K02A2.6-like n=1 Tax=Ornithodoros turicata TaxID=34597 RepID=UPI0031392FA0
MATQPSLSGDDNSRRFRSPGIFDPAKEDWNMYQVRFEAALRVARVTEEEDKTNLLITSLTPEVFKHLYNLVQPRDILSVAYSELTRKLAEHYTPKKFKEFERWKLFSTRQNESESVKDFLERLSAIIPHCEYEAETDVRACSLLTAFIVGLHDPRIRARLVLEKGLTLETATNMADKTLTAEAESRQLHAEQTVHKLEKRSDHARCFRCGNINHDSDTCRFRDEDCHNCGKTGHIAKMCRANRPSKGKKSYRNVEYVSDVFFAGTGEDKFVTCQIGSHDVLLQVDTGSQATLLNTSTYVRLGKPKLKQPRFRLRSFSKDDIPLRGQTEVEVSYGGRKRKLEVFFTNMEHTNLLGRDWIRHLGLDLNELFVGSVVRPGSSLEKVLSKFPDLFQSRLGRCTKTKVHLHFKEAAQPKFFKPRPIPFATRQAVEADIERQVKNGVLTPVDVSEWATPIVVVPKPNGAVRVCGDFSVTVNPQLAVSQYPLPRPEELLAVLNGGQRFSKLDLSEAYLQMELDDEAQKVLVINTHKGLFRFTRMPFGIASAPAVFQRIMEQVTAGIPSVACYLDDIIVTGKSDDEHLDNLQQVFSRLREFGFTLKREKCAFFRAEVEYLGHVVNAQGFRPSPKKVSAVLNMPAPTNVSELRSFLGMVQHYGKYLKSLADVVAPLNDLLKKAVPWEWSSGCVEAFEKVKMMLVSVDALTHFDPAKPIFLAADASSRGLGAVIYHKVDGKDMAMAHASKTLTAPEKNYSQIEREALAIIFGVRKFHQYLWGRRFVLYTDHKPLTTIFGPKKGIPATTASRLQRWALILMNYTFDIQYTPTAKFGNADGLSRLPEGPDGDFDREMERGIFDVFLTEVNVVLDHQVSTLPISVEDIAVATSQDPDLARVAAFVSGGWPTHVDPCLEAFFQRRTELTIYKGCLLWGIRTVIPPKFRSPLLSLLHEGHIGQTKMKMLARSYLWWPGLDRDIEREVRSCEPCASVAAHEVPVPLHQWEPADKPWVRLHADFAELNGKHYLIVIDAYSKWPEIEQLTSTAAEKTAIAFSDMFTRNGLPEVLVTDNGPPFTSKEFKNFLQANEIRHVLTPPYHPQSNGLAENFVRTFKTALRRAALEGTKDSVRSFLFKYRITPHATTGRSPCAMLNGRQFRHFLDFIRPGQPDISGTVRMSRERQKRNYDKCSRDRSFGINQKVWMLDPGKKSHWKVGVVLSKQGSAIYVVEDEQQRRHRVHKDHLKCRHSVDSWPDQASVPEVFRKDEVPLPPPCRRDPRPEEGNQNDFHEPHGNNDAIAPGHHEPGQVMGSGDAATRRYPSRLRRGPQRYGYS